MFAWTGKPLAVPCPECSYGVDQRMVSVDRDFVTGDVDHDGYHSGANRRAKSWRTFERATD